MAKSSRGGRAGRPAAPCVAQQRLQPPESESESESAAKASEIMPGFDYKFLEKPKRRFLCPLCAKAMREPVRVSTCGHRFCDTCLQEFLR